MKKSLIYSFIALACFAAGCKKDYQNSKVYLISQIITDDRSENGPIDTALYTYDDHYRISTVTDGTAPRVTFKITYDDQNRVSVARKYSASGTLIVEFDFFYSAASTGYYFWGPSHVADTAYFTFNDKHQLTRITTLHSGIKQYTYDSRGNLETALAIDKNGNSGLGDQSSYSYDTAKNPFSESTPANNYFLMYVVLIANPSTLINNVVVKNGQNYIYAYNKDGFPVSATIKAYQSDVYLYYSYIVK